MSQRAENPNQVLCADFTTDVTNGKNPPCINAGGVLKISKNDTKEPIYYILVTAGVLIAGYFAYKKFKK